MNAVRRILICVGVSSALVGLFGMILSYQFLIYSREWNMSILIWIFGAYNCMFVWLVYQDYMERFRNAKAEARPDDALRKRKPGAHRMR